jgi:hypothetical protein
MLSTSVENNLTVKAIMSKNPEFAKDLSSLINLVSVHPQEYRYPDPSKYAYTRPALQRFINNLRTNKYIQITGWYFHDDPITYPNHCTFDGAVVLEILHKPEEEFYAQQRAFFDLGFLRRGVDTPDGYYSFWDLNDKHGITFPQFADLIQWAARSGQTI